jgi:hypothetical protein
MTEKRFVAKDYYFVECISTNEIIETLKQYGTISNTSKKGVAMYIKQNDSLEKVKQLAFVTNVTPVTVVLPPGWEESCKRYPNPIVY